MTDKRPPHAFHLHHRLHNGSRRHARRVKARYTRKLPYRHPGAAIRIVSVLMLYRRRKQSPGSILHG